MKKLSLLLSLLLFLSPSTAFANSAQMYFQGISSTGTLVAGTDSPLIVEHEQLTFDLQEFPKEYYAEKAEYLAYPGKVTAMYQFYNPAAYDVTVQLAFPFGQTPDYGYSYDKETELEVFAADAEKYDILVDDMPIAKTIRHTLLYRGDTFQLEKDLSRLQENAQTDAFWQPDLPVTKYVWQIDGIDESEFQAARLGFRWKGDAAERKLLLLEQAGGNNGEEEIAVTRWVENGDVIELYVFGEPLEGELDWFTENGAEDTPFDYTLTFLREESMTYDAYVFAEYAESSGISRQDWYNAMTQHMKISEWDFGILAAFEHGTSLSAGDFLRWYEYEITVPAGGRIRNTVTAPMYPSVDVSYEPPIYKYTYLLSPAKTWAEFQGLFVEINTPYFLQESSGAFSFEKMDNGYACYLERLPEGELQFTLSAAEKAKNTRPAIFLPSIVPLTIGGLLLLAGVVYKIRK